MARKKTNSRKQEIKNNTALVVKDNKPVITSLEKETVKEAAKKIMFHRIKAGKIETERYQVIKSTISDNSAERLGLENINLNTRAETLIDQLTQGVKTAGRLTSEEKVIIFAYFDKFSPVVGRILDLHTNLPMSSLQLRRPNLDNPILVDYIFDTFKRMIEESGFIQVLHLAIRNFWKFGVGAIQIIDDYEFEKDTIVNNWDKEQLANMAKDLVRDEETQARIDEITTKYINDKTSISIEERNYVISQFIPIINKDYNGIKKVKIVDPFDVIYRDSNDDIDFFIYDLKKSSSLDNLYSKIGYTRESLKEKQDKARSIGYPEAIIRLQEFNSERVDIDTDPYNDIGTYVVSLERTDDKDVDNSLLNRIIESVITLINAKRKQREIVGLSTKVTRLVKANGISEEQMLALDAEVKNAAETDEGYVITTNYECSIEDIILDARESLDLQSIIDQEHKNISNALGITESLIGGDGNYGDSFLKIELLTSEYTSFRNLVKTFIENQVLKPIAVKLGFVTKDDWGIATPIIPEVSFDRLTIARSSEDFQMLLDLAKENKLPWTDIYKTLGFNFEEVTNNLVKERTSIISNQVGELLDSSIQSNEEALSHNQDVRERVKDSLFLSEDIPAPAEDEDNLDLDASADKEIPEEAPKLYNLETSAILSTSSRLTLYSKVEAYLKEAGLQDVKLEKNTHSLRAIMIESYNNRQPIKIKTKDTLKGVNNKKDNIVWLEVDDRKCLIARFNCEWLEKRYNYLMNKYNLVDRKEVFKPFIVLAQYFEDFKLPENGIKFNCNIELITEIAMNKRAGE